MGKWNRVGMLASMAALVAPVRYFGSPLDGLPQPAPKLRPRREKYRGQRTAHLVGAWQPMTRAEIADHNRAVDERRMTHAD